MSAKSDPVLELSKAILLLRRLARSFPSPRPAAIVSDMKRISYAGGSILTGDEVAEALLDYVTEHSIGDESVAVDIRVLELDGTTRTHTLVLGPATELDVADVAEETLEGEVLLFPLPVFPPGRILAVEAPSAESEAEAEVHAADFNRAVDEIDRGQDH